MLTRTRRAGFSILEVIALIAVMAIIGAVVIPVAFAGDDAKGVVSTKSSIDSLQAGYVRFFNIVGSYPSKISMLSDSALREVVPLELNTCGGTILGNSADNYRTSGAAPFFGRVISPTGGLPVGIGVIDAAIPVRALAGSDFFFVIRGVKVADGEALNDLYDTTGEANNGDASNTLGRIRFPVPSADGTFTQVQYELTVSNGC
ncbi:MAG: hypothetical protein H0U64_00565 [Gemmatimonadaceae bacterium]|nr:hypothetical protein [Gemmatimonadaceae bacterium]